MSIICYNRSKTNKYVLSEKPIASGGEGSVYEIIDMPDKAAKIYFENKRSETRHKKLKAMTEIPADSLPECAWPQELLYIDEQFCGFIMDKVSGIGNLIDFFVYENRSAYTWNQYIISAINISAAINNIHDAGIIIGDLKPDNIIIDPESGKVKLVDTDSYQITGKDGAFYPCTVATPEYIPPELQNINFEKDIRKKHFNEKTDDFALAVILFKILMNGVHPFACFCAEKSLNNLEYNIRNGFTPYFKDNALGNDIYVTMRSPEIDILPYETEQLFRKAFTIGIDQPDQRPSAEKWFYTLSKLNSELKTCKSNIKHIYYNGLSTCPWCDLTKEMEERKHRFINLLNSNANNQPYAKKHITNTSKQIQNLSTSKITTPNSASPSTNPTKKKRTFLLIIAIILFALIPFILWMSANESNGSYITNYNEIQTQTVSEAQYEHDDNETTINTMIPQVRKRNSGKDNKTENTNGIPLVLSFDKGNVTKYARIDTDQEITFETKSERSFDDQSAIGNCSFFWKKEYFDIDINYNTDAANKNISIKCDCGSCDWLYHNWDKKGKGILTLRMWYDSPCSGTLTIKSSNTLKIPIEIKEKKYHFESSDNNILEFADDGYYYLHSKGKVDIYYYYGDERFATQTLTIK